MQKPQHVSCGLKVYLTGLLLTPLAKPPRNQAVFNQGADADAVFFIEKGKVKVTVSSEEGKEAVIAILEEASFSARSACTGRACAPSR
jgi:CRP-like cAMP-binding protein